MVRWGGVRAAVSFGHLALFDAHKARSAMDGAAATQVLLGLCCLKHRAVTGTSIDYVQCFDRIPQQVIPALALELGMDPSNPVQCLCLVRCTSGWVGQTPPGYGNGIRMLNAALHVGGHHAAKHKAAGQHSRNKRLFSDIATGAFRCDGRGTLYKLLREAGPADVRETTQQNARHIY